MSEIIRVENLSYIYNQGMPDATKALDDVSFTVEEGDFVGIIGSTGSGKSTLISHFNGLNRPTSGRVLVDGRDLWEQGADLRSFRFLVGLVMQYPEYQLFEETCARDIAYGPRNMVLNEAEVQRRVREAAAFVGLSDELLEKSPFELSGGQKRRVAIAGVMAMHPRVLVLDEPAAGLDPEGRDTILSQIRDYHEKTGITVLLVSHSMEDIAKYANRVLVMHRAKIAMYDTVENVFARAQELLELGLSVPQVTQIFLKLRQMGLDISADVYTIPYAVKTIQKALAAMELMHRYKIPFGVSICYTAKNYKTVTSDEFLDLLISKGCVFAWYFHYMPVGMGASTDLLLTPEQRTYMKNRVREIRGVTGGKELYCIDFQNDGEFAGGCVAGGRIYCHINAAGDVEPCVFIHYSGANIREKSFLECLQQPLFLEYRKGQPFNGNHLRPCPMLENPDLLPEMVKRSGARSTDLEAPESAEHLCEKCKAYAACWQPTAEQLWDEEHRQ